MKRAQPSAASAWERARDFGIDVSLLAANLRKSPAERLRQHARALAALQVLRAGMKQRHE